MCIGSYADISVHAPTRGATSNSLSFSIFSVFQSTLPREERLLGLNFKEANSIFQSTLPREKRLLQQYLSHFQLLFQSTLPREERHNTTGWQGTGEIISIHAPTRGATIRITVGLLITQNFNPRSHERSDTPIAIPTTPAQFQSTLPREERLSNVDFKSIPYISIHAPTRGATHQAKGQPEKTKNFNPRSHERSDSNVR